ncbi:MAG: peptidase MA family metallohydrolase [Candidatus Limnocylindrales bacterium]
MRRLAHLAAWLLVLVSVVPAAAQPDVRFGEPVASGGFGEPVTFSTTFQAEARPLRVEMLSRQPGDATDLVTIAALEREGETWRATVFKGGHIVPNTSWEFRFRVVTEAGAVEGPTGTHRLLDERFEWDVLEGERVNVWTYEGGDRFARDALKIAETAMADAADLLGVGDIEPVDFLLYTDTREFREAMGPATRENIGGQAHPRIRTLFGLIEPRQIDSDWADELITHELAHLVFHEAVDNPYQYPPRWLNEGLAVYLSKGYTDEDRREVRGAAGGGTIIPLEGLGGQFPTRPGRQSLAYAVSISAVDYFVDTYGQDQLVELINAFGAGSGLEGAFLAATGEDFEDFDSAWLEALGAEEPEPYGPTESEPGPVPEEWAAEVG